MAAQEKMKLSRELEAARAQLEGALESDENWRALKAAAARNDGADQAARLARDTRLKKALQQNPLYRALRNINEAIFWLQDGAADRGAQISFELIDRWLREAEDAVAAARAAGEGDDPASDLPAEIIELIRKSAPGPEKSAPPASKQALAAVEGLSARLDLIDAELEDFLQQAGGEPAGAADPDHAATAKPEGEAALDPAPLGAAGGISTGKDPRPEPDWGPIVLDPLAGQKATQMAQGPHAGIPSGQRFEANLNEYRGRLREDAAPAPTLLFGEEEDATRSGAPPVVAEDLAQSVAMTSGESKPKAGDRAAMGRGLASLKTTMDGEEATKSEAPATMAEDLSQTLPAKMPAVAMEFDGNVARDGDALDQTPPVKSDTLATGSDPGAPTTAEQRGHLAPAEANDIAMESQQFSTMTAGDKAPPAEATAGEAAGSGDDTVPTPPAGLARSLPERVRSSPRKLAETEATVTFVAREPRASLLPSASLPSDLGTARQTPLFERLRGLNTLSRTARPERTFVPSPEHTDEAEVTILTAAEQRARQKAETEAGRVARFLKALSGD